MESNALSGEISCYLSAFCAELSRAPYWRYNKVWCNHWHFMHLWDELLLEAKCPVQRQLKHTLLVIRVDLFSSCDMPLKASQVYSGCLSIHNDHIRMGNQCRYSFLPLVCFLIMGLLFSQIQSSTLGGSKTCDQLSHWYWCTGLLVQLELKDTGQKGRIDLCPRFPRAQICRVQVV